MNETAKIARFLEDLLDQYKNGQLTPDEERRITEFYMKERFFRKKPENEKDENNEKDYLVLGWYIYEFFLKKNNN